MDLGEINTKWTYELKEHLRELLMKGYSAAKCARELNAIYKTKFTRNSVIGISNRSNLTGASKSGLTGYHTVKKTNKKIADMKKTLSNLAKERTKYVDHPGSPLNHCDFKTATGREKNLEDLGGRECRFPITIGSEIVFCADEIRQGTSYCEKHFSRCTRIEKNSEC